MNQQHDAETDKRTALEATIATKEAELENERLGFIEREKELHNMQQLFNDLVQQVRTKENDKNLSSQRLEHLKERSNNLEDFFAKSGRPN